MKEIKAVIQPQRLSKLRNALRHMQGFPGMTVIRAEGCSYHDDGGSRHSIQEELTEFSPKVHIEIVAPDDKVEEILRIIHANAHTGRHGDGIVWVTEVLSFQESRLDEV